MLVDHAVGKYEHEVSVIAYYGSHATGTATPASDLDLFYIPVEGKSPDAARSFVLNGTTFDFWPITWGMAGHIAAGRFRSFSVGTSILLHAKLLYSRTDEDRARFESLRRRAFALKEPAQEVEMVRRGLAVFPNAVYQLDNLRHACAGEDVAAMRECAWRVVDVSIESLALVNRVTFDRDWARDLTDLDHLSERPADLQTLVRTITTSSDCDAVLASAERLVAATREILRDRQEANPSNTGIAQVFRGAYAEIHEHIQKLRTACQANEPVRASRACRQIQDDVSRMIASSRVGAGYSDFNRSDEYAEPYREVGLPDLMAAFDSADLTSLLGVVDEFHARVISWLEELGIDVNVFASTDELARWLGLPGVRPDFPRDSI